MFYNTKHLYIYKLLKFYVIITKWNDYWIIKINISIHCINIDTNDGGYTFGFHGHSSGSEGEEEK